MTRPDYRVTTPKTGPAWPHFVTKGFALTIQLISNVALAGYCPPLPWGMRIRHDLTPLAASALVIADVLLVFLIIFTVITPLPAECPTESFVLVSLPSGRTKTAAMDEAISD